MGTTYARSGAGRLALAAIWLLPLSLVLAGCMVNRSQSVRAVTPPDPPPVPRAKPVAPADWRGQATHYPETGQTAYEPAQSPTPVPAPMPTNGQRVHVITEGQSLYAVARLYGLSTADLIEANQLSPPYKLTLGQRLLECLAARDEAHTTSALVDDGCGDSVLHVVGTGSTTGVDEADAAHVVVDDLPAAKIDRVTALPVLV